MLFEHIMAIELKNIVKTAGLETHIHDTSVAFHEGGFNILLGTTLSGKTTLLRIIAGLEKATSGELWFKGQNVSGLPVQKRNLAMVYQQFINYPNWTVFENIASPLRVSKMSATEIKSRVNRVAELLQLGPMLSKFPRELSGGQQQRVSLARALAKEAELVLLDEPLANLDYKLREELRSELPRLFKKSGATVIYASTEPVEALLLGGYTATLFEGKICQFGKTSDVYRHPNDLRSAQVFSDPPMNIAKLGRRGGLFYLSDSLIWSAPECQQNFTDGCYILGFRSHKLSLQPEVRGALNIKGSVELTEITGSESMIHLTMANNHWISLTQGINPFHRGDIIDLYLNPESCYLFDEQLRLLYTGSSV